MLKEDINSKGGLDVGGKKYKLEFVYQDNEAKADSAVNAALKLITQDNVVAIIGPNSSKQAIPAGGACNDNQTPMVSPWSTNPDTTKDRPWVFRAAFLDPFQGPVAANFAAKQFGAKTAAVLFDIANDYSRAWPRSSRSNGRRRAALAPWWLSSPTAPRTRTSRPS
jgi:branched-chain amino acid transport system substrate-binding protein